MWKWSLKVIMLVITLLLGICTMCVLHSNGNTTGIENIVVSTSLGVIRGIALNSSSGRKFYAFRGIRYARPPLGSLRFKAPQPADPWEGVFDATEDGPMCPQPIDDLYLISEDCLRLNIYTRNLPNENDDTNGKPVMVYIHPGGFYSLSGQSRNFAGPLYMMNRDTVFVTLNYRLGSLGFLSTGTLEASGNYGLKDQSRALRWIQEHIHRFGGNPRSVTLLGYSAGAMSITLHLVSPMSRNLFHKAIVMSGSAVAQWEIPAEQIDLARRQASLLNCTNNAVSEMMNCLMNKSAIDYGTSLTNIFEFGSGHPIILFKPVIEPDLGQDRFLVEDPAKSFLEGRFMRIPIIAGITRDEFAGSAIYTLKDSKLRKLLNDDFYKWGPVNFLYERKSRRSREISEQLRSYYLHNDTLSLHQSLLGLGHLYADGVIGFGMDRFVHLASRFTNVYQYCFTYKGRFSHVYYPTDNKPYGVVHHDDLLYLLTVPSVAPIFTVNDPEWLTVERLTRMWTTFANKGHPLNQTDELFKGLQWKLFERRHKQYLEIGENLTMKSNLYEERYQIWRNMFPISVVID